MRAILIFIALMLATTSYAETLEPYSGVATPPPLVLKDLQGKEHDLNDFKGKVVLVNFWATWCPPCRIEMPSISRLQQNINNQSFVILAVDMGEPAATVNAFLPDKMKRDFIVLMDDDGVVLRDWKVTAFPTTYIIDSKGKIRYLHYGALRWDDKTIVKQIRKMLP